MVGLLLLWSVALGRFFWGPRLWWSGKEILLLCRFVSLNGVARVELLLRVWWRVRDELRECERIGGVLGTETLDRYDDDLVVVLAPVADSESSPLWLK